MKLIIKKNPDKELTVTVEYPKENSQVQRILNKIKSEEQFLIGSEHGRDYKVFIPDIYYIESVDKRIFIYTRDMVFRSEKRLYQLEKELKVYDFVKISRTCLLNINELVHIETLANSRLEAKLSNGEKVIVCIAFLCVAVHNIAAYIFYDSFLKEIICEYVFIELIVLGVGVLSGWFIKSNWWMSFIYVTPAFLLAYLLGIVHIKREIQSINERLHERGRKFEKRG